MGPPTKRRKTDQPEEITFDPSARQEYLSGFHKRKVARKEQAREIAIKKEKEERVRDRKELREKRKEDLEAHVKAIDAELKKQNEILDEEGEDGAQSGATAEEHQDGFEGFGDDGKGKLVLPEDDEYVDEDKYTTVTVEAMGGSEEGSEDEEATGKRSISTNGNSGEVNKAASKKRIWTKQKPAEASSKGEKAKKKKRKFRYESKAERSAGRQKQKAKNSKAAEARRSR